MSVVFGACLVVQYLCALEWKESHIVL